MNVDLKLSLVVMTAAVGLGLFAPASAMASCAGPVLSLGATPTLEGEGTRAAIPMVQPGEAVAVRGAFFIDGCNDTGSHGSGCSGPGPLVQVPSRNVDLTLTQAGKTWKLGIADASDADPHDIAWDVDLPADLRPGAATLTANTAELLVSVGN